MSNTLVITHKDCFDGHTSAWIISRFVDPDAEFVPARYGDPAPNVKGRDVIIADFSYARGEMFRIGVDANSLTVLDHHHTAEEALRGLNAAVYKETGLDITVVFDMERSGAGITWDHFMLPTRSRKLDALSLGAPAYGAERLVNYVEDRDLWYNRLPHAREFMANVYAAPMTFEAWDELAGRDYPLLLDRGRGILSYMDQYGTKALAEAQLRKMRVALGPFNEADVWTVNLPYMNCSDYLSRLMLEKNVDMVASYFCRNDGRWQFSLRGRNGCDVSKTAKSYGGGGHIEAAGFDVESLEEVFHS